MPILPSAKKALRRDHHRTLVNQKIRSRVKTAQDNYRQETTPENLKTAYQVIDRAAKKHVIHPNKAARLKSQLAKSKSVNTEVKPKKKTVKRKSTKKSSPKKK